MNRLLVPLRDTITSYTHFYGNSRGSASRFTFWSYLLDAFVIPLTFSTAIYILHVYDNVYGNTEVDRIA